MIIRNETGSGTLRPVSWSWSFFWSFHLSFSIPRKRRPPGWYWTATGGRRSSYIL